MASPQPAGKESGQRRQREDDLPDVIGRWWNVVLADAALGVSPAVRNAGVKEKVVGTLVEIVKLRAFSSSAQDRIATTLTVAEAVREDDAEKIAARYAQLLVDMLQPRDLQDVIAARIADLKRSFGAAFVDGAPPLGGQRIAVGSEDFLEYQRRFREPPNGRLAELFTVPELDSTKLFVVGGESGAGKTTYALQLVGDNDLGFFMLPNNDFAVEKCPLNASPEQLTQWKKERDTAVIGRIISSLQSMLGIGNRNVAQSLNARIGRVFIIIDELGARPDFMRGFCSVVSNGSLAGACRTLLNCPAASCKLVFVAVGTGASVASINDPGSNPNSFAVQILSRANWQQRGTERLAPWCSILAQYLPPRDAHGKCVGLALVSVAKHFGATLGSCNAACVATTRMLENARFCAIFGKLLKDYCKRAAQAVSAVPAVVHPAAWMQRISTWCLDSAAHFRTLNGLTNCDAHRVVSQAVAICLNRVPAVDGQTWSTLGSKCGLLVDTAELRKSADVDNSGGALVAVPGEPARDDMVLSYEKNPGRYTISQAQVAMWLTHFGACITSPADGIGFEQTIEDYVVAQLVVSNMTASLTTSAARPAADAAAAQSAAPEHLRALLAPRYPIVAVVRERAPLCQVAGFDTFLLGDAGNELRTTWKDHVAAGRAVVIRNRERAPFADLVVLFRGGVGLFQMKYYNDTKLTAATAREEFAKMGSFADVTTTLEAAEGFTVAADAAATWKQATAVLCDSAARDVESAAARKKLLALAQQQQQQQRQDQRQVGDAIRVLNELGKVVNQVSNLERRSRSQRVALQLRDCCVVGQMRLEEVTVVRAIVVGGGAAQDNGLLVDNLFGRHHHVVDVAWREGERAPLYPVAQDCNFGRPAPIVDELVSCPKI